MATKPLRGPSLSSAFREMHIETRGRHHSAPTRAAVRTWGNRAGSRLGGKSAGWRCPRRRGLLRPAGRGASSG